MKTILLFFVTLIGFSQIDSIATKKYKITFDFAPISNLDVFRNPISLSVNYVIKKTEILDFEIGIRSFYFNSKEPNNFSDVWAFNPTFGISKKLNKTPFEAYVSLGYYLDSYRFNPSILFSSDPSINNETDRYYSHGITFAPGMRIFAGKYLFFDANFTLIVIPEEKYKGIINRNNVINIGFGIAF
jgi:hypothetical protein